MSAPRFVLVEMGEYEECLAKARAEHRRLRDARSGAERDAAERAYHAALTKAREVGARVARDLGGAARAA